MSNPYDGTTPPPGGSDQPDGGQPGGEPPATPPSGSWGQQPPASSDQPGAPGQPVAPGTPGAPVPPGVPPAPPGGYGQGAYQQGPAKKTSLPVWSLILGILSFLCFPVILAIAAIITGFIGRSKAKEEGSGTGMAVTGIVLGFLNIAIAIVLAIVLFVTGFAIFGVVQDQVKVAEELNRASIAADVYKGANGSYTGLSTAALAEYGYSPSSDVNVTAMSNASGTAYCVEGSSTGDFSSTIHMPAETGSKVNIEINGKSYVYSMGSCPATFQ